MASVNKVILVGNLGADPEIRHSANGDTIASISVATTDTWKDKSGNKQETTEWHRVTFFGRLAELAGKYLHRGSTIYVEGHLRTRKWQDKAGNDRYNTEIVADQMQFLGGRGQIQTTAEKTAHREQELPEDPFGLGGPMPDRSSEFTVCVLPF